MTMPSGPFEVRPLHSAAELRQCQDVQRQAWGIVEEGYLVPVATLAAVAAYGGLVLGALEGDRVIGFSFAFRGVIDGAPCLYSQLTGVRPEVQGGGVGRRIKAAQRVWAREQGLPLIVWAFDLMQAMNAHYNLVTLDATATQYHANFYGLRADALNPGLPTDRLIAVWPTAASPSPEGGFDMQTAVPLLAAQQANDGRADPLPMPWEPARLLSIAIPASLAPLRAQPARIAAWQGAIRQAFTCAFAEGYEARTFRRSAQPCYILARKEE